MWGALFQLTVANVVTAAEESGKSRAQAAEKPTRTFFEILTFLPADYVILFCQLQQQMDLEKYNNRQEKWTKNRLYGLFVPPMPSFVWNRLAGGLRVQLYNL